MYTCSHLVLILFIDILEDKLINVLNVKKKLVKLMDRTLENQKCTMNWSWHTPEAPGLFGIYFRIYMYCVIFIRLETPEETKSLKERR